MLPVLAFIVCWQAQGVLLTGGCAHLWKMRYLQLCANAIFDVSADLIPAVFRALFLAGGRLDECVNFLQRDNGCMRANSRL